MTTKLTFVVVVVVGHGDVFSAVAFRVREVVEKREAIVQTHTLREEMHVSECVCVCACTRCTCMLHGVCVSVCVCVCAVCVCVQCANEVRNCSYKSWQSSRIQVYPPPLESLC